MIELKTINDLLNEHLAEGSIFVVDISIKPTNKIFVVLDGDEGVTIKQCTAAARFINAAFEELEEDYELNVSSPGVSEPLRLIRQYPKNIGRELMVTTDEKEVLGVLTEVGEDSITIQEKKRKKEIINHNFKFNQIKKAIVQVSFN